VLGFRHALKATPTQTLFLIVYAAFIANALEGIIIDSDHWRHFYLLAAMVWGMMSVRTVAQPAIEAAWIRATTRGRRPVAPVVAQRRRSRVPRIAAVPAFG
jgi:hypothetical protein